MKHRFHSVSFSLCPGGRQRTGNTLSLTPFLSPDMSEVEDLIRILKRYVYDLHINESTQSPPTPDERHLTRVASRLLTQLRERDLRRPISSKASSKARGSNLWEMEELRDLDENSLGNPNVQNVLALLPFASSFGVRYLLFRDTMAAEMRRYRSDWSGSLSKLKIRRDHLIEDGYDAFIRMSPDALRSHVRVKFIDAHGVAEEGIDGGGLFKEFLTDLIKETFMPSYGLFLEGEDRRLCPNPGSLKLFLEYAFRVNAVSRPN
jgi:ubiquitin-protein ligase E3 C